LVSYAISNFGFDCGVNTWQIIAPINLEGIKLGIIKKGFQLNAIKDYKDKHLIEFLASTTRTILFKLDLN